MKLNTKLTAICGVLLILTAAVLSGLMLWQVREQSYETLIQQSKERMNKLTDSFIQSAFREEYTAEPPSVQKVLFRYCFRNCGVSGGVLAINGELVSAPTLIDPRIYLPLEPETGLQVTRCAESGKHYLILGHTQEWKQREFDIYLVEDASFIHARLTQLLGRFLIFAVCVCSAGLFVLHWLIRRSMAPLHQLQQTAALIAAGNYDRRTDVDTKDEVGSLAENFNVMAAAVEQHVRSLTEQNARQQMFMGSAAHEFKTPLTSLLLNVDTLRTVYLPEEKQQELLENMDSQLHWLEQLVRKLLKLLSLGKTARMEASSVPELLNQVQKITKGAMEKYGTVLQTDCTVETLPMDADLLCSALVNLIENAAKASRPGQPIFLRANANILEVADCGCGIRQEELGRITEPFYMCDPSRSKKDGGFGLGMALVREIAAVHHASLEIESTLGAGTTVRLVFPESGNQTVKKQ